MEINKFFPLYFLGNICYYRQILANSNVCLALNEPYQKQTFRNHFELIGSNKKLKLTIPIQNQSKNKTLKEVKISYDNPKWTKLHLRTIESAYGSAPFFEYYFDDIQAIFNKNHEYLAEMSLDYFDFIWRKLDTNHVYSIDYKEAEEKELNLETDSTSLKYRQVFQEYHGFVPNLSILDLLMNLGPESLNYILSS